MIRPLIMESGVSTENLAAPQGVEYSGARVEGQYLILRFTDMRVRTEKGVEFRTYLDRYFSSDGKEVWRETGEVGTPLSFWKRIFA